MAESKDLAQVRDHYLDYPYPKRNSEDEKTRLLKVYGDYLGELNYWLFQGKEDFKNSFRILIAGGGTGDSTIYLAEQLKNTDAEIIYLDFSKNSMNIAQERAKIRGLTNIKWINDSIFNIPELKLGKFDYIQCSGVLHHLKSPDDGLKVLANLLSAKGGMNIMIYAQYGRTGIYQIQEIMRKINKGVTSRAEEVKNAWTIMNNLPQTNWYNHSKNILRDHINYGDIGMYDLFLHKQDRAYTVPQIYEFVNKAGMNFIEFSDPASRFHLNLDNYIKDPELLKQLKKLDQIEQRTISEILYGHIIKHSFFISKKKNSRAKFTDLNNIPYFYLVANLPEQVSDYIKNNQQYVNGTINFSFKLDHFGDITITIAVSKYTESFFRAMIGDKRSLKGIQEYISNELGKKVTDSEFMNEVNRLFPLFENTGILLMQDKELGPIIPM